MYFSCDRANFEKRPSERGATEINTYNYPEKGRASFSGFCVFKFMFTTVNTPELLTPLAAELAEDGRFRLFWCGQYVGGLWSAEEVAQAKAATPQSFDELITVLDRIARDPPQS